jgi:hypothetical protein
MFPPKYSNSKLITNSLINNPTNNALNMDFFCNIIFLIMVLKLILIILIYNVNFKGKKIKVDAP